MSICAANVTRIANRKKDSEGDDQRDGLALAVQFSNCCNHLQTETMTVEALLVAETRSQQSGATLQQRFLDETLLLDGLLLRILGFLRRIGNLLLFLLSNDQSHDSSLWNSERTCSFNPLFVGLHLINAFGSRQYAAGTRQTTATLQTLVDRHVELFPSHKSGRRLWLGIHSHNERIANKWQSPFCLNHPRQTHKVCAAQYVSCRSNAMQVDSGMNVRITSASET